MKLIALVPKERGLFAKVDDEDYEYLSQWVWHSNNGYAKRMEKNKAIYMHRVIASTPEGLMTDHKDGDRLNNRKSNLRHATRSQNQKNVKKPIDGLSSKYKGVCLHKRSKKWQAAINVDGKCHYLGYYDLEEDAARAYDKAALRYHREFASLNFPKDRKDYSSVIDRLESLRAKNNHGWMSLFRLAFRENPEEAKLIAKGIFDMDKQILQVAAELYE